MSDTCMSLQPQLSIKAHMNVHARPMLAICIYIYTEFCIDKWLFHTVVVPLKFFIAISVLKGQSVVSPAPLRLVRLTPLPSMATSLGAILLHTRALWKVLIYKDGNSSLYAYFVYRRTSRSQTFHNKFILLILKPTLNLVNTYFPVCVATIQRDIV